MEEFLLAIGGSSGGTIGSECIILYQETFSIRTYLGIEFCLIDDLQNLGYFDLVGLRPFVFAIEAETYYMFLATKEEGEQFVYCFDENNDRVTKTRETFSDYIYRQVKWGIEYYEQSIFCTGDLLKI